MNVNKMLKELEKMKRKGYGNFEVLTWDEDIIKGWVPVIYIGAHKDEKIVCLYID